MIKKKIKIKIKKSINLKKKKSKSKTTLKIMNIFQHIHSATAKVTFAGLTFLIDPILDTKRLLSRF